VIPIGESLIYVQPLYLRAAGGRIPELKRVVVAVENQVAMDETLELALARLFGGAGAPATATPAAATAGPTTTPNESTAQLARDAQATYDRARAAQRGDDWATYGAEMKRLGEILQRLSGGARP
jgi:uncharacterized membrane protein (UPF0182 family)